MRSILSCCVLVIVCASQAQAADRLRGSQDWSGLYAGVHVGYAFGKTGNDWRTPPDYPDWAADGDIRYDGFTGGAHIGALKQIDRMAFGFEADISIPGISGDDAQYAGFINEVELDFIGTLRGRLGYVHQSSLFYVTGGVAYTSLEQRDLTNDASSSRYRFGWTVGAGYEHAFDGGWRGRLEYLYADFGESEIQFDFAGRFYRHRANDIDVHTVRAGISYAF